jgi:hypothetical protein
VLAGEHRGEQHAQAYQEADDLQAGFEVVVSVGLGRVAGTAGAGAGAVVGLGVAAHWIVECQLLLFGFGFSRE